MAMGKEQGLRREGGARPPPGGRPRRVGHARLQEWAAPGESSRGKGSRPRPWPVGQPRRPAKRRRREPHPQGPRARTSRGQGTVPRGQGCVGTRCYPPPNSRNWRKRRIRMQELIGEEDSHWSREETCRLTEIRRVRSTDRTRPDDALDETNAAVPSDSADDARIGSNWSPELSPELEPLRTLASNTGS
jgi:hypothetical protein